MPEFAEVLPDSSYHIPIPKGELHDFLLLCSCTAVYKCKYLGVIEASQVHMDQAGQPYRDFHARFYDQSADYDWSKHQSQSVPAVPLLGKWTPAGPELRDKGVIKHCHNKDGDLMPLLLQAELKALF